MLLAITRPYLILIPSLKNNGNVGKNLQVFFCHNEGYFVQTMEGYNSVFYARPYTIAGKPAIVKPWTSKFCFNDDVLPVLSEWIQLPNLSLSCRGFERSIE